MRRSILAAALTMGCSLGFAGEVKFEKVPVAKKAGAKTQIAFTLSAGSDVEVAILDARGKVVRHLAAGVLGGKAAPPAPLKAGLSQEIEWDGQDDYGEKVKGGPFKVRVRAGMSAKLEKIVGGDPYAFYSRQMGGGDHAAWRVTGLEAKSDGKVYVLGNVNNYGPAALRQYDAEGNFLKTVFPPPAGKPIADVKGWGVTARADGTYMFQYNDLDSPALSKTMVCGNRGRIANLMLTPDNGVLKLRYGYSVMTVGTDGTLRAYTRAPVFSDPAMPKGKVRGPFFSALAPDGKAMYVSGLYACESRYGSEKSVHTEGFWRDGQVWKVDLAARKASVFFALDKVIGDMKTRGGALGHSRSTPYATFHGVAVDVEGRVFVCDRQNKRVVVLDQKGKLIREVAVAWPDAIALKPGSKSFYVTTRVGNYHRKGEMKLLKFNDWSKDTKPSVELLLAKGVGTYRGRSYLATCKTAKGAFIWVAYTTLPVRVYRDKGNGLELAKDFYQAGSQRALDLQHMAVDPKTEDVYVADGFKNAFRINDWKNPRFERCMTASGKKLVALSVAIDARNRYLYTHDYIRGKVRYSLWRYRLDEKFLTPAPVGKTGMHAISGQRVGNDWRIGLGLSQRGIAVAPDGSIAALGSTRHTDYSGPLYLFQHSAEKVPWEPLHFKCFGKPRSGGIRFDPSGNLYVGKQARGRSRGSISKFAPTGSLDKGRLFPTAPEKPARIYEVNYGYPSPPFARTPRFGVDGYGRIYYPTSLLPRVSVIDNQGNPILAFGTYGNRDSMGGLKGDLVPTRGVPMAWPNSVDATDDYIYVTDIVNIRLLRLAKTFAAAETIGIK
jgi:hypothetical protein